MSLELMEGRVVHFPQRRSVFAFDEEVSRIFPDMAMRSIPMYEEAHRLHVSMFAARIGAAAETVFYDIGASCGHFFKAICNRFHIDPTVGDSRFSCTAVDNSFPMLSQLHKEMPWVRIIEADAAFLPDFSEPADFISMFYLLQFLQTDEQKMSALQWAYRNLKKGGVLFLGQKSLTTETHTTLFTEEYYRFRMDNGYTMAEIQAKTEALKGSMWPSNPSWLEDLCLGAGFIDYVETTRWLMFSTSMCTK
jgi:ubiquinone/menaquinone biosynthesis C-methylase UbiE